MSFTKIGGYVIRVDKIIALKWRGTLKIWLEGVTSPLEIDASRDAFDSLMTMLEKAG